MQLSHSHKSGAAKGLFFLTLPLVQMKSESNGESGTAFLELLKRAQKQDSEVELINAGMQHKGILATPASKLASSGAQLKYLYGNVRSMGNKQEQLEMCAHPAGL